jgi:drug/metabolite transporter (DMT)-like permease
MIAIGLGLLAAFFWGLHDYCVRAFASHADALALILRVFTVGAMFLLPFAGLSAGWDNVTSNNLGLALLSGLFYALGGYGLYRAFSIGPVRLVAPVCGAYPLLSVAFHGVRGGEVGSMAWLGVLAVIGGIALVARGEGEQAGGSVLKAVAWSLLAALGFALTFCFSQWASETLPSIPVIFLARLVAVGVVAGGVGVRRRPLPSGDSIRLWRMALLLGALDTLALMLVAMATGYPHPEFAAVTASLFGIVTILLAARFLGEKMLPVQWFGVFAAFVGIALLSLA